MCYLAKKILAQMMSCNMMVYWYLYLVMGKKNQIITSDYRTIEKAALHRIISVSFPKTRTIPRLFVFDSCEGSYQKEFIRYLSRNSTNNLSQYIPLELQIDSETSLLNNESNKCIKVDDLSTTVMWNQFTKNPDYLLAQVHAANTGFQAKCNTTFGSYLIYEFVRKMAEHGQTESLSTMLGDIQNKLHDMANNR
eukprot:246977_1